MPPLMNNRAKAVARAALTALALAIGTLTIAAPASAAPTGLDCSNAVDIGLTVRQGDYVKGSGSWTKCTSDINKIEIVLWKQAFIGYTSQYTLTFDPADFGSHAYTVPKNCVGTGTKKWYTTIEAWNADGQKTTSKRSNTLSTSC